RSQGGHPMTSLVRLAASRALPLALAALPWVACGGGPEGEPVRITVPRGASVTAVADTLSARGLVDHPTLFRLYVRLRRADRALRAGIYEFRRGEGWDEIVNALREGRVITVAMTIPEGWTLARMIP